VSQRKIYERAERFRSIRTSVVNKYGSSHLTTSAVVTSVISILIILLYKSEKFDSFKPQKSEHSTEQK
jgi:hypothetical protein